MFCFQVNRYNNSFVGNFLQDKEQPDTQDEQAGAVQFSAKLALDDNEAFQFRQQPGTDGFRMDSAPLFTVVSD